MKKYVFFLLMVVVSQFANAQCTDLFFSEYSPATGNNRYLEIYNPTGASINLTGYSIKRFRNGAARDVVGGGWSEKLMLSGTVPAFGVWVVCNGQTTDLIIPPSTFSPMSDPALRALANQTGDGVYNISGGGDPFWFNGDDIMTLEKNDVLVDIIGRLGEVVTTAWSTISPFTGSVGMGKWITSDYQLIRKPTVQSGLTSNPAFFNPMAEWDTLPRNPRNNWTYLGAHTSNCTCVLPTQPSAITGNTTVCEGSSQSYSIALVSGATSYTWTSPSGWSGTSTGTSINLTVGNTSGNITVKSNNACGSSIVRTLAISVNNIPATPGSISGSNTVCFASANTYSVSSVNGATSYTWSLPSGWSGTSTSTSINATVSNTGGIISVIANNGCGSSAQSIKTITVIAPLTTPASIFGNSLVCASVSQTYSASAVSGATSYIWTLPGGWLGTSTYLSINVTTGVSGGNITVAATNMCSTSSPQSLLTSMTTGIPANPGSIAGNTTICSGSSQGYSVATVANASTYTWSFPSGWSGTSLSNSITAIVGNTSGTITVSANNGCGASTVQSLPVNVNISPAQPISITGNNSICAASTQNYSISPVAGATSYTWSYPSGWSGSSTTTSIVIGASNISGNVSVTANNALCSSVPQNLAINVTNGTISLTGTIVGATTLCANGGSQIYSITSSSGATSYNWNLPSGWTGSSSSAAISGNPNSGNSGNISVSANNICGAGASISLPVTVNTIPMAPPSISGPSPVCAGTFVATGVSNATSYTWGLPSGWTGNSTTNSILVTAGVSNGFILVSANNSCGSSSNVSLPVLAAVAPSAPIILQSGATLYTSLASSGYQWYFQGVPIAGANGQFYTPTVDGPYSVSVTVNGCTATSVTPFGFIKNEIQEMTNNNLIEIFPNPTTETIFLRTTLGQQIIEISNILGEVVYRISSTSNINTINMKEQNNGIYFIQIQTNEGVVTKKIILKK